jgi:hypothetical protein
LEVNQNVKNIEEEPASVRKLISKKKPRIRDYEHPFVLDKKPNGKNHGNWLILFCPMVHYPGNALFYPVRLNP